MENVWQTAKSMEREGIAFYQKLSNETKSDRLAGLFYFLSQQELDHLNFFDTIENKLTINTTERNNPPESVTEAFEKIKPDLSSSTLPKSEKETYKIALTMETKAIEYYSSLLEQATDDNQRLALKIIINEEKNHESMMREMVESME